MHRSSKEIAKELFIVLVEEEIKCRAAKEKETVEAKGKGRRREEWN